MIKSLTMADIREQAEKGRNLFERVLRLIPGFRGYHAREDRREADKLLREELAAKLDRLRADLDRIMRDASDRSDALETLGQADRVRKAIEKLSHRVRHATYGYSGFFDAVKVDEAELDRIYDFDLALLERIESLQGALKALAQTLPNPAQFVDSCTALLDETQEFDRQLDQRRSVIERKEGDR